MGNWGLFWFEFIFIICSIIRYSIVIPIKDKMKTAILISCLGLVFISCKKSNVSPYQSQGVITGYDGRTCAECGGLFITIKNDTTKNPLPRYDINESLQQLGINPNTPFPINVSLNWRRDTASLGAYGYIIVSKIKVN
jgi:hypothetical protein